MISKTFRTVYCIAIMLFGLGCVEAAKPVNPSTAGDPPIPQGRRYKDIVKEKFPEGNVYIGGTTGWKRRGGGDGIVLDREFSYVTPENDFKQRIINPSPGVFNWSLADNWVKHCKKTGQVIRAHGPISPQCSTWAKEDCRTAAELEKALKEFYTAFCKRYNDEDVIQWFDVINETILENGAWHGPCKGTEKWECPWTLLGYDESDPLRPPKFIKMAFEIANKYAPKKKLIINQHGEMEQEMWDKVKGLVGYLRRQGLRVDGIGWQAHVDTGFEKNGDNLEKLGELIDWAHANNLSFHVTEANAWLKKEADYQGQAETFAAILKVLLERRGTGEIGWNTWNISDGVCWRPQWKGCLFFLGYKPKPAYYAIQKLLENPPSTKSK
ncbi:MAG: endo-1,4-beta-xylanase [Phycisphaerae bacterium]|nr:endo-1,4-beta-xylanase [Phycisphaerae bacterium]